MVKHRTKISVGLMGLGLFIGVACVAQGDAPPLHSDVVREVKQETAKLPVFLQIRILPALALVEAQSGQVSVAKSTFEQVLALVVRHKEERAEWFTDLLAIAEHQRKAGQNEAALAIITQALILAQVHDNDSDFINRLNVVAVTQARIRDRAGVEGTLARIHQLSKRHHDKFVRCCSEAATTQNIAEVFIKQGRRQAAQAILHAFVNRKKNWETREMAVIFAKLGDVETTEKILRKVFKAQKAVQAVSPDYTLFVNTETMLTVAKGFWEAGKSLSARSMLRKAMQEIEKFKEQNTTEIFDQAYGPYHLWPKVAALQAKFGNLQVAQHTLAQISIEEMKGEPLHAILETQLQRGDIEKARQTAQHPALRGSESVIEAQVRYGDVEGAKMSLHALETKIESDQGLQRYKAKYHIVEHPRDYQNAVRMVAKARVKTGEYSQTLEWARNQATLDLKTYALLGIAEGLLE